MSSGTNNEGRMERIDRLLGEIRRVVEREYALVGKYRELAASFEALMPDPDLRHDAVLLALSTTMKLGSGEIGKALVDQQEELALLEQAVGGLFEELGATGGGQGAGAPAGARAQPGTAVPGHCAKCGEPLSLDRYEDRWKCRSCSHEVEQGSTAAAGQARERSVAVAAQQELQRKCPRCGGVMHYHEHHQIWQCYTCAHEDAAAENAGQGKQGSAPSSAEQQDDIIPGKVALAGTWTYRKPAAKTRPCPVCRKNMDWHEQENLWRCFFCKHKMRVK